MLEIGLGLYAASVAIANAVKKCPGRPSPEAQFLKMLEISKQSADEALMKSFNAIMNDKTLNAYDKVTKINSMTYPIADILQASYKSVLGKDIMGECKTELDKKDAMLKESSDAIKMNIAITKTDTDKIISDLTTAQQLFSDQQGKIAAFDKYLDGVRVGYLARLAQLTIDGDTQKLAIAKMYQTKLDDIIAKYKKLVSDSEARLRQLAEYSANLGAQIQNIMQEYGSELRIMNESKQSDMSAQRARAYQNRLKVVSDENHELGNTWGRVATIFRTNDAKSAISRNSMLWIRKLNRYILALYILVYIAFVYFVFTRLYSIPPPIKAAALCILALMPFWAPYIEISIANIYLFTAALVLGIPFVPAPFLVVRPTFTAFE